MNMTRDKEIKEALQLSDALHEDAHWCYWQAAHKPDVMLFRRLAVLTSHAFLEGNVNNWSAIVHGHAVNLSEPLFETDELSILQDEGRIGLTKRGDPTKATTRRGYRERLKFVVRCISRFKGRGIDFQELLPYWNHVCILHIARRRISHPTCIADLSVEDHEMRAARDAPYWWIRAMMQILGTERHIEDTRPPWPPMSTKSEPYRTA